MSNFEVRRKDEGPISTLYLKGFLDAHTAPQLERCFQELLSQGRYRIVVNFSELSYISSAGLGVFMGFIETVRKHQGDIKLASMPAKIYRVFDLLGFPLIYEIYGDESEAVAKFVTPQLSNDEAGQEPRD